MQAYDAAATKVIHNYIVAEFVALSHARRLPRRASLAFAASLTTDESVDLVWVDSTIHEHAMALLDKQVDKSYSLCDAVSFVVMHQRNISEALTTDRHFEQAGFRRLLG